MPKFCDPCKEAYQDFADTCAKCGRELRERSLEEIKSIFAGDMIESCGLGFEIR